MTTPTPPTTMPQAASTPAPEPPTTPRAAHPARFGLFFGIVAAALTLGAIALAVFAPALTTAPQLQVPQGWQQIYNANPATDSDVWTTSSGGCSFPSEGLDVESDSACAFAPASGETLGDGVLVVAKLAPAADVALSQDAGIVLGNSIIVLVSQQGDYTICRDNCDIFAGADNILASGSTVAWHADAFVPNEIAVLYNQGTISFYANGQYVDQVTNVGPSPAVALATSTSGEALFTNVAIYTGSGG